MINCKKDFRIVIWSLLVYMGKKIRAGFECVCEMVPALENGC